jgi:hypothetical protein
MTKRRGFSRLLRRLTTTKGGDPETSACLQQGKDCRMTKKKGKDRENNEKVFILR